MSQGGFQHKYEARIKRIHHGQTQKLLFIQKLAIIAARHHMGRNLNCTIAVHYGTELLSIILRHKNQTTNLVHILQKMLTRTKILVIICCLSTGTSPFRFHKSSSHKVQPNLAGLYKSTSVTCATLHSGI